MNLVKKATQKVGEGVGVYSKTEEGEDFKQQEKYFQANSSATDRIVKELTPDSASGSASAYLKDKMGRDSLAKTTETKRGETFISLGSELKSTSYDSVYAEAITQFGESLRQVGEVHQTHDAVIIDSAIGPMKLFNENVLKDIHRLEKNYKDKRADYDSAIRSHKSKSDAKTQANLDAKTRLYEEARSTFLEKVSILPVEESSQVGYLAAYCEAQSEYYKNIAAMYNDAANKLLRIKSNAPNSFAITKTTTTVIRDSSITTSNLNTTSSTTNQNQISPRSAPPIPSSIQQQQQRCKGIYDFEAGTGGELSFRKGEIMNIRKRVNDDWYEAELGGTIGLVPVNYVELC